MNKTNIVSVGIDVSKATLDIALRNRDHSYIRMTVQNTTEGVNNIKTFLQTHGITNTIPCVIESTGDYHLLCTLLLSNAGYSVKCINPLLTKQYQRSSVRGVKTDSVDASRLSDIGLLEPKLPVYTAQLHNILVRKYISSLAKLDAIEQQLTRHTRQLKESFTQLSIDEDTNAYTDILTSIKKQKHNLQTKLCAVAPQEAHELASVMRGVTDTTLSVLLVSLMDKDFKSRDALVAYVGLDVMPRRSGAWVGKERLSKRGNAYIRKLLYHIGWGLSRHNAYYRKIYLRMKKNGKHYTTCLIAIARKFLSFLYAFYWKKTISLNSIA